MALTMDNVKTIREELYVGPRIPQGLTAAIEGLTKEIIRHRPEDIYIFAANHFEKLLEIRKQCDDPDRIRTKHRSSNKPKTTVKMTTGVVKPSKEKLCNCQRKFYDSPHLRSSGWSLNETAKVLKRHRSIFGDAGKKLSLDEINDLANGESSSKLATKHQESKDHAHASKPRKRTDKEDDGSESLKRQDEGRKDKSDKTKKTFSRKYSSEETHYDKTQNVQDEKIESFEQSTKISNVQEFNYSRRTNIEELQSSSYVQKIYQTIRETTSVREEKVQELKQFSNKTPRTKSSNIHTNSGDSVNVVSGISNKFSKSATCLADNLQTRTDGFENKLQETRNLLEKISSSFNQPMKRSVSAKDLRRMSHSGDFLETRIAETNEGSKKQVSLPTVRPLSGSKNDQLRKFSLTEMNSCLTLPVICHRPSKSAKQAGNDVILPMLSPLNGSSMASTKQDLDKNVTFIRDIDKQVINILEKKTDNARTYSAECKQLVNISEQRTEFQSLANQNKEIILETRAVDMKDKSRSGIIELRSEIVEEMVVFNKNKEADDCKAIASGDKTQEVQPIRNEKMVKFESTKLMPKTEIKSPCDKDVDIKSKNFGNSPRIHKDVKSGLKVEVGTSMSEDILDERAQIKNIQYPSYECNKTLNNELLRSKLEELVRAEQSILRDPVGDKSTMEERDQVEIKSNKIESEKKQITCDTIEKPIIKTQNSTKTKQANVTKVKGLEMDKNKLTNESTLTSSEKSEHRETKNNKISLEKEPVDLKKDKITSTVKQISSDKSERLETKKDELSSKERQKSPEEIKHSEVNKGRNSSGIKQTKSEKADQSKIKKSKFTSETKQISSSKNKELNTKQDKMKMTSATKQASIGSQDESVSSQKSDKRILEQTTVLAGKKEQSFEDESAKSVSTLDSIYSYVLTEGSPCDIPDTVTTVIFPDPSPSDSIDIKIEEIDNNLLTSVFGESIHYDAIDQSSISNIDLMRGMKNVHDISILRQDLQRIKEEDEEDEDDISANEDSTIALEKILGNEEHETSQKSKDEKESDMSLQEFLLHCTLNESTEEMSMNDDVAMPFVPELNLQVIEDATESTSKTGCQRSDGERSVDEIENSILPSERTSLSTRELEGLTHESLSGDQEPTTRDESSALLDTNQINSSKSVISPLSSNEKLIKAVMIIQRCYRKYKATKRRSVIARKSSSSSRKSLTEKGGTKNIAAQKEEVKTKEESQRKDATKSIEEDVKKLEFEQKSVTEASDIQPKDKTEMVETRNTDETKKIESQCKSERKKVEKEEATDLQFQQKHDIKKTEQVEEKITKYEQKSEIEKVDPQQKARVNEIELQHKDETKKSEFQHKDKMKRIEFHHKDEMEKVDGQQKDEVKKVESQHLDSEKKAKLPQKDELNQLESQQEGEVKKSELKQNRATMVSKVEDAHSPLSMNELLHAVLKIQKCYRSYKSRQKYKNSVITNKPFDSPKSTTSTSKTNLDVKDKSVRNNSISVTSSLNEMIRAAMTIQKYYRNYKSRKDKNFSVIQESKYFSSTKTEEMQQNTTSLIYTKSSIEIGQETRQSTSKDKNEYRRDSISSVSSISETRSISSTSRKDELQEEIVSSALIEKKIKRGKKTPTSSCSEMEQSESKSVSSTKERNLKLRRGSISEDSSEKKSTGRKGLMEKSHEHSKECTPSTSVEKGYRELRRESDHQAKERTSTVTDKKDRRASISISPKEKIVNILEANNEKVSASMNQKEKSSNEVEKDVNKVIDVSASISPNGKFSNKADKNVNKVSATTSPKRKSLNETREDVDKVLAPSSSKEKLSSEASTILSKMSTSLSPEKKSPSAPLSPEIKSSSEEDKYAIKVLTPTSPKRKFSNDQGKNINKISAPSSPKSKSTSRADEDDKIASTLSSKRKSLDEQVKDFTKLSDPLSPKEKFPNEAERNLNKLSTHSSPVRKLSSEEEKPLDNKISTKSVKETKENSKNTSTETICLDAPKEDVKKTTTPTTLKGKTSNLSTNMDQGKILIPQNPEKGKSTQTFEQMAHAASKIQRCYKKYKLRRAKETKDGFYSSTSLQHTGEFHDCIPLSVLDSIPKFIKDEKKGNSSDQKRTRREWNRNPPLSPRTLYNVDSPDNETEDDNSENRRENRDSFHSDRFPGVMIYADSLKNNFKYSTPRRGSSPMENDTQKFMNFVLFSDEEPVIQKSYINLMGMQNTQTITENTNIAGENIKQRLSYSNPRHSGVIIEEISNDED